MANCWGVGPASLWRWWWWWWTGDLTLLSRWCSRARAAHAIWLSFTNGQEEDGCRKPVTKPVESLSVIQRRRTTSSEDLMREPGPLSALLMQCMSLRYQHVRDGGKSATALFLYLKWPIFVATSNSPEIVIPKMVIIECSLPLGTPLLYPVRSSPSFFFSARDFFLWAPACRPDDLP